MTKVSRTNGFFNDNIYSNMWHLGVTPVRAFTLPAPAAVQLFVAALLTPISMIALCFAAVFAVLHSLLLLGAGVVDRFENTNNKKMSPA